MSLKLYIDLMSQPSRALYILLKKVNYNFEPKLVNLGKAEHLSEEFKNNVNKLQKVPVIDHQGFLLTESVAILNYLSRENIIPDALYPRDSRLRARVQEFLEWQHIGLRLHCAMYFRVTFLNPLITGERPNEKEVRAYTHRMNNALEDFDTKWLGQGNKFIVGDNITVADLLAACEIEQPRMAGFDPMKNFKNIGEWMTRVQEHFGPHYQEGHAIVNKVLKRNEAQKSKL